MEKLPSQKGKDKKLRLVFSLGYGYETCYEVSNSNSLIAALGAHIIFKVKRHCVKCRAADLCEFVIITSEKGFRLGRMKLSVKSTNLKFGTNIHEANTILLQVRVTTEKAALTGNLMITEACHFRRMKPFHYCAF